MNLKAHIIIISLSTQMIKQLGSQLSLKVVHSSPFINTNKISLLKQIRLLHKEIFQVASGRLSELVRTLLGFHGFLLGQGPYLHRTTQQIDNTVNCDLQSNLLSSGPFATELVNNQHCLNLIFSSSGPTTEWANNRAFLHVNYLQLVWTSMERASE